MRFGNWRGVTRVVRLAAATGLALVFATAESRAQGLHTIPRLTPAIDLNTGGPYYAPPIPYGHYAGHDLGGKAHGLLGGLGGKLHGLKGGMGHGAGGHGLGHGGGGCGACGGAGCGACGGGHGMLGGLLGKFKGHGHGNMGFGHASTVMASGQGMPTPQGPVVMSGCGDPGCGVGYNGCGNGCGLLNKFKGNGHGLGHGGDSLCGGCGGAGCGLCGGLGHLKGKAHGLLGGALAHLTGANKIKWFNGPGGPVPLTPGYVPYINPVRSPRDFFAFPPFSDSSSGVLPVAASYVPPTAPIPAVVPAPPVPGMPVEVTPPPPAPGGEMRGGVEGGEVPAPDAVPAPEGFDNGPR